MACRITSLAALNTNEVTTSTDSGVNSDVVDTLEKEKIVIFSPYDNHFAHNIEDQLSTYMRRPVRINHTIWDAAMGPNNLSLKAAYETLGTAILQKAAGYRFYSGKVHLQFVVNGTPYAFGLLRIGYIPAPKDTNSTLFYNSASAISQVNMGVIPHVDIDPGVIKVYDMVLPMGSCTKNWGFNALDVNTGALYYNAINALSFAADDVATEVTICTFMWFEDFKLYVPTIQTEVMPTGIISKPLSIFNRVLSSMPLSKSLGSLPMVLDVATNILSFFGYSKPLVYEISRPTLNSTTSNLTQCDGRAAIDKLTTDPKCSVSFSNDAAGLGDFDDMDIYKIIKIPGLVQRDTFPTTASEGDLISFQEICPTFTLVHATMLPITPLCHVAMAFSYWTGDLNLTIEIIASSFHRGTLLFAYAPNNADVSPTMDEAQTRLANHVVQISGNTKFNMIIPYSQRTPFLPICRPFNGTHPTVASADLFTNGRLFVYCMSALKTAGNTSPIYLNYYLSGTDTTTFQNPDVSKISTSVFDLQTEHISANMDKVIGGEKIRSIKQLTNKSSFSHSVYFDFSSSNDVSCGILGFPLPESDITPALPYALNRTNSFCTWFEMGYTAQRGTYRWTVIPPFTLSSVLNLGKVTTNIGNLTDSTGYYSTPIDDSAVSLGEITGNVAYMYPRINPFMEFETAPYSTVYFRNTNSFIPLQTPIQYVVGFRADSEEGHTVEFNVSSGEDYSLHFYRGAPSLKLYT